MPYDRDYAELPTINNKLKNYRSHIYINKRETNNI